MILTVLGQQGRLSVLIGLLLLALGLEESRAQFGFSNDRFAQARLLSSANVNERDDNTGATSELNEPAHGGFGTPQASLWYRWRPLQQGTATIRISSLGFNRNHVAAVYQGFNLFSLSRVASVSGFQGASFEVRSGDEFLIAVDTASSGFGQPATGAFTLRIDLALAPAAPRNDDFARRAAVVSPLPTFVLGTNAGATEETGEPRHVPLSFRGGASVWFEWVATDNEHVRLSVLTSSFAPSLAVYSGTTLRTLTEIESSRGAISLDFQATQGQRYSIAVDRLRNGSGPFTLDLSVAPPANDLFALATAFSHQGVFTGTTKGASAEPNEPSQAAVAPRRSVWYEWTSSASVSHVTWTSNSGSHTLEAYRGTTLAGLSTIDVLEPEDGGFLIREVPGTKISLAIVSSDEPGNYRLTVRPVKTAYETWRGAFRNFPDTFALPSQDADQDGLSNVMEMLLGSHPLLATEPRPAIAPTLRRQESELFFDYVQVRTSFPGVLAPKLISEVSTDLHEWQSITPEALPKRRFKISLQGGTARQRFVRLRAALP